MFLQYDGGVSLSVIGGRGEFLQYDGVCFCNRRKGCDSAIRGCSTLGGGI